MRSKGRERMHVTHAPHASTHAHRPRTHAQASSFTAGSPVCARQLPPHTVEGLQAFFEHQLAAVSGLLNRPEIPALSGPHRQLLVKAYDLGLVDANGHTEAASVRQLLADTEAQVRARG